MDPAERPRLHHLPLLEAPPVAAPLRLLLHSAPPYATVLVYMNPRLTSVVSMFRANTPRGSRGVDGEEDRDGVIETTRNQMRRQRYALLVFGACKERNVSE